MSVVDLTHLKPGDAIAVEYNRRIGGGAMPDITHEIYYIDRITPKQMTARPARNSMSQIKVWRHSGEIMGASVMREFSVEATPEILADHEAQVREQARWRRACIAIDKIMLDFTHRKLTTEQMEAIVAAYKATTPAGTGPATKS